MFGIRRLKKQVKSLETKVETLQKEVIILINRRIAADAPSSNNELIEELSRIYQNEDKPNT